MTRNILMVGISALAFAASAASAQTNGDTTDGNGNRRVVNCTPGAGNTCIVDNQTAGNTNNTGSVGSQNGGNNSGTVTQIGNRNLGVVDFNGSNNTGEVRQNGNNLTGNIFQVGSNGGNAANNATVFQRNNDNSATIRQTRTGSVGVGTNNSSTINQGTGAAGNFGAGNGQNNVATSTQNGNSLTSTITQNRGGNANVAAANFNTATVSQTGTGSLSTVTQNSAGNTALVSIGGGGTGTGANSSSVTQTNTTFQQQGTSSDQFTTANGAPTATNNPNSRNLADVAIIGQQNGSTVSQDGVQNTVNQTILGGGSGNTSAAGTSTNPGTNGALPGNRPEGNSSTINQTGRGNYAATSIGGSTPTTGVGRGNLSTINQTQTDATAQPTTLNSVVSAGTAHRALVYQRGTLDETQITQTNNMLGGGGTNLQSGSVANVSQLSFNSTTTVNQTGTNVAFVTQGARTETSASDVVNIIQTDAGDLATGSQAGGAFGGGGATGSQEAKNSIEVVQYGIQNTATVAQNAVNAAGVVYQAVGTRANNATLRQGDGNVATGADTAGGANAAANTAANAYNLSATIYQTSGQAGQGVQTGSTSATAGYTPIGGTAGGNGALNRGVEISQNGQNLTARANQAGGTAATTGTALAAMGNGEVNSNNAIAISQINGNSSATVSQNGTSLGALVEQRSTNATTALPSIVTINQSGSRNRAIAYQAATAGASSSSAGTAGVVGNSAFPNSRTGANSAEIMIMQTGTGASATVEQRGRGQYASITQSGSGNTGGILQDTGATNAVAMLNQSGTGNTFFITQTAEGQYINVSQSGTGNGATTITERAPTGVNGGGTTSNTMAANMFSAPATR